MQSNEKDIYEEKPNIRWCTADRKKLAELRRFRVAALYKRGYSYSQIAKMLTGEFGQNGKPIGKGTICKDVQVLLKEWREERKLNIDEAVQLELSRIDDIIRECWTAWEKSKKDYKKQRESMLGKPKGDGVETVSAVKSSEDVVMYGDVRYLDMIHKQLQERRKLLGLYAPEKTELTGKDGKELAVRFTDEELDSKLEELMQKMQ